MAIDKTGNITLNQAADASIPFQVIVSGVAQDISAADIYFVTDSGLKIVPDIDPNDPTTRIINLTPAQLQSVGTKTARLYDLIQVVNGKRSVLLSATIIATGFAVGALA